MNRIHKYTLDCPIPLNSRKTTLLLSQNHKVLSVGEQNGILTLWVIETVADYKDQPSTVEQNKFTFFVIGTGGKVPEDTCYTSKYIENMFIETVHMNNGLVWHVFEESVVFYDKC